MHNMEMTARQMEWAARSFAYNLSFIPEDRFEWKPEPTAKSAREIVEHIAAILQGAVGVLNSGEFKLENVSTPTRAEAEALMQTLTEQHAAALRKLTEADLERVIHWPFGDIKVERGVLMSVIDTIHHHGQIVYLQELLGDEEMHMKRD